MNRNEISKLALVLEEEFFPENEVIIRQGAVGNTFYIIKDGHVKVTELDSNKVTNNLAISLLCIDNSYVLQKENTLTTMTQGQYFGEIALLQQNPVRTATVTAITKVHLFSLEKEYFTKLIGVLPEENRVILHKSVSEVLKPKDPDSLSINISNIKKLGIMGQGAYGTVYLCSVVGKC